MRKSLPQAVLCIGGSSISRPPGLKMPWPNELADMLSARLNGDGEPKINPVHVQHYDPEQPRSVGQLLRDPHLTGVLTSFRWDMVVLEIGTADARAGGTPKRVYGNMLTQLLERLAYHEIPAIVCTPPRVRDTGNYPRGWNRTTRRWIAFAPKVIEQVVSRSRQHPSASVKIVNWQDMPDEMYQQDGVHPNEEGCAWLAQRVFDVIVSD